MSDDDWLDHLERDHNGVPFEHVWIGGQEVIVRYDDIPESDITVVKGMRCTTPLRTVIDLAPTVEPSHLRDMVEDCLRRGMFTVEEALVRVAAPDMTTRPGARLLFEFLVGRSRK